MTIRRLVIGSSLGTCLLATTLAKSQVPSEQAAPSSAASTTRGAAKEIDSTVLETEKELQFDEEEQELQFDEEEQDYYDSDFDIDSAPGLRMSGWLDVVYKNNTKEGSHPFVDVHHIYLIADAQLNDVWRAFVEMEYEHAPKLEGPKFDAEAQKVSGGAGEMKLERGYVEGNFMRELAVRAGKFNTPMGLRVPSHWIILAPILAKPIHEDNKYVPVKSVGLNAFGWLPLGSQELGYNVFVSNGTEIFGTNKPKDDLTGFGGDLNLRFQEQFLIGGSYYQQKNLSHSNRLERSALGYVEMDWAAANLLLRSEVFWQWRGASPEGRSSVSSAYALFRYRLHAFEPLSFAYRYDRGKDEKRGAGRLHQVHSFNLSLQPEPFIKLSAEVDVHRFRDSASSPHYNEFTLWAGVAF